MVLRIVHPDLLPDTLHQLRQEQGLIQADHRALSQPLQEALAQVLSFVPEAGRVGVVERDLGLWQREVQSSGWSFKLGAAPERVWNGHAALGAVNSGSAFELGLKIIHSCVLCILARDSNVSASNQFGLGHPSLSWNPSSKLFL